MSNIKATLNSLCGTESIHNALIITKDGMVIESNFVDQRDAETLGAFMSQVGLTIKNGLANMNMTDFTRYVIQSNEGRIFLVDLGKSMLIALTDLEIDAGKVNVALFQAANEIKKTGRLDI